MGYLKADARAELLLNTAKKLMQSEGYASVTARKIAQESGAALGHINRHFTSLSQLKCQAFLAVVHEKVALHNARADALTGIDAVLVHLGECHKTQHEIELWREVSVLAHQDRALHEIFIYAMNLWHRTLTDVITRGVSQQALRCHDTPSATAWRLMALVLGLDTLAMHGVVNDNEERVHRDLLHIVRLELQPDMCAR